MRAKKKDYFICESCGAEVPADAKVCARCGVSFDAVEAEVVHVDGSVDVSTETFECSECGAEVPVNAKRCPKCGAEFEE
jgi:ribosomal protein L40E